jgi:hypothetical protein
MDSVDSRSLQPRMMLMHLLIRRSRVEHLFFGGESRKFFFLDFKNMVAKGTLTISGGKKQFIQQDILTTLGEKNR